MRARWWVASGSVALLAAVWLAARGGGPDSRGALGASLDAVEPEPAAPRGGELVGLDPMTGRMDGTRTQVAPGARVPDGVAAASRGEHGVATVVVRVIDRELGTPASGASVAVTRPGSDGGVGGRTDEHGVATLALEPGSYLLGSDEHWEWTPFEAVAGERSSLELELTIDTVPFHARVVDAATGAPVEGARLRWKGGGGGKVSDASGAVEDRVPKKDGAGVVDHDAYVPARVPFGRGHGQRETALVVALRRGGLVRGVVRDGDRGAVAGARMRAWIDDASRAPPAVDTGAHWSTVSGADGSYLLAGLAADATIVLEVWFDEHAQLHELRFADGEERRLDVDLASAGSVVGTLAWPDGLPLAGRTLQLWSGGPSRAGLGVDDARATTDADGAFRFGDLSQGTWTITLEPQKERETFPLEPTVVHVAAGSDATRVELRTYVPRFVAGRCVDPDGESLAWVELGVVRDGALVASGFSDERGAFQVGPVPDGAVTLTAITCPTRLRRPPDIAIDAGASGLEVRFERR